jgi:hypothetical protein
MRKKEGKIDRKQYEITIYNAKELQEFLRKED